MCVRTRVGVYVCVSIGTTDKQILHFYYSFYLFYNWLYIQNFFMLFSFSLLLKPLLISQILISLSHKCSFYLPLSNVFHSHFFSLFHIIVIRQPYTRTKRPILLPYILLCSRYSILPLTTLHEITFYISLAVSLYNFSC